MITTATPTEPPEWLDATHPVAGFLAARPPWWGDPGDDPVHPLPPDALGALATPQGRWPGLTAAAVEWEAGFTDRCAAHRLAGAWAGRPFASATLYASPLRPFSPAEITRLGWPPEVVRSLPALTRAHDDARERLDGVAGRLMTEPAFLADRDALRSGWRRLGDADRPPLPVARLAVSAGSPAGGTRPPSAAAAAFAAAVAAFLDRWGLVRLATWDLPEPQGPAAPSGWRPPDRLAPPPGVHLYVPLAYPVPAADLLGQVRAA